MIDINKTIRLKASQETFKTVLLPFSIFFFNEPNKGVDVITANAK